MYARKRAVFTLCKPNLRSILILKFRMATHTVTDYEGLHDRMCRLREMEIGLDGAICAKGGEVRVHLPYMAACNQTLFKRITTLLKNNQNKLILNDAPLVGIESIVNFFYSGKLEVNSEILPDILEAAMATECLDTVEFCINFANNSNANLWSHFLKVAFKYPLICQAEDFVPNLILKNISIIPREVLMKDLNPAYLSYILEKGKVEEKDMALCLSVFLDVILNDKMDVSQQKHTLALMKDICRPNETLNIANDFENCKVLALLEASLSIEFTESAKACCEMLKRRKPSSEIITKVVQWIRYHHGTLQAEYLIEYACNAFKELPVEFPCDVLCELIGADWLEFPEFEIFQTCLEWLQDKTEDETLKHRILGKLRFGLMSKKEIEKIISKYGGYMHCVATNMVDALQYHMHPHSQPLHKGQDAKQRQAMPGVLGLIQSKNIVSNQIELMKSSISGRQPLPFTKTNCELPGDCSNLSLRASANVNGYIFISGELGEGKPKTNIFHRFNTCLNSFLTLSPMSMQRGTHTLTKVGEILMAVGGISDGEHVDNVEEYDIIHDTWKQGKKLPIKAYEHAASSLSDQVFITGGTGSGTNKSVLCYSKRTWETKSPMLYGRQCHSMVAYGDMLIVCGGAVQNQEKKWENVSVVECFDTKLDQWTEMISKPIIPYDTALATCSGGHVYILGGLTGEDEEPMDEIQRYNIAKDKWEICQTKLPGKGSRRVYLGFLID